jgi:hypothetical protein
VPPGRKEFKFPATGRYYTILMYTAGMSGERGNAPTDRVWAIWALYAQDFPLSISLDQRSQADDLPYLVTVGDAEEPFCRLSDEETSWLIAKKVGIR